MTTPRSGALVPIERLDDLQAEVERLRRRMAAALERTQVDDCGEATMILEAEVNLDGTASSPFFDEALEYEIERLRAGWDAEVDWANRLLLERDAARSDFAEIVAWLQRNGFPFDWSSTEPAPRCLREPVAQAWAEADNEPLENYLWALDQEQTWY